MTGSRQRRANRQPVLLTMAGARTAGGNDVVARNYYWTVPDGVAECGLVTSEGAFTNTVLTC